LLSNWNNIIPTLYERVMPKIVLVDPRWKLLNQLSFKWFYSRFSEKLNVFKDLFHREISVGIYFPNKN